MTDFVESSKEHRLIDIIDSKKLPLTVKTSQNFTLRDETVLLENQVLTVLQRKQILLICGKNWKKETFRLQMMNVKKVRVDVVEECYPNTIDEICKIRNEVKHVYLKKQCQYGQHNLKMYTRCKICVINYKEEKIGMIDEFNGNFILLPISILFDSDTFVFIHRKETLTIEEFIKNKLEMPVSIHAHYLHDKTFPEGVVRITGLPIYDAVVTVTEIKSKLKYEIFSLYRNIKAFELKMLHLPEKLSSMIDFMCDQYRQHLKEIAFSMHFDIFKERFYGSLELDGQFIYRNCTNNRNCRSISKPNESSGKTLENSKTCSSDENMLDETSFGFNDPSKHEKDECEAFEKIALSTHEESTETPQSTATLTTISHIPDNKLEATQKSMIAEAHHKRDFSIVFPQISERHKRVLTLLNTKKRKEHPIFGSVDTLRKNFEMENQQKNTLPVGTRKSAPARLELLKEPSSLDKFQYERKDLLNSSKSPPTNLHTSTSFQVTNSVNKYFRPIELLNGNNQKAKNSLFDSVDALQGNSKMEDYRIKPLTGETRNSSPARLELSKHPSFLGTSKNKVDDLLSSQVSPPTNFHTPTSVRVTKPGNEYLRPMEPLSDSNAANELKNEDKKISAVSPLSICRDINSTACFPSSQKAWKRLKERPSQKFVYKLDSGTDTNSAIINKDVTQVDTAPKTKAKSFPLWRPVNYKVFPGNSTHRIFSDKHIYESIIYAQMNKSNRYPLNIGDPLKERELKSLAEVKMLKLSDVIELLQKLNLSRHKNIFKNHIVTGPLLIDSNEETFTEMGTTKFEARKLYKYIRGWRPRERLSFSDNNSGIEKLSVQEIFVMLQRIHLPILAMFCKENLIDGIFLRDLIQSGYVPKVLKEEYNITLMDIEYRRLKLMV